MNPNDVAHIADFLLERFNLTLRDDFVEILWNKYSALYLATWIRITDERIEEMYLLFRSGIV